MALADAKLLVVLDEINKLKKTLSQLEELANSVSQKVGPKGDKGDKGDPGPAGVDGKDGRDGKDGINGKDGIDGKDGVSVVDAKVDFDGSLVLTLSDGSVIDAGTIIAVNNKNDLTVYKSGAVQVSAFDDTVLSIAGYVEVTDVDGVTRKLAVVA